MYIPAANQVDDPLQLAALMQAHPFATVITQDGGASFASHLPVLLREGGAHGTIVSHLARANPQWRHFGEGREALLIFHGPHAYISPTMYEATPAVPTWNYAVVHAYGVPRVVEDAAWVEQLVRDTVHTFEAPRAEPWPGDLTGEYMEKMLRGIVGFQMEITRIEGKFKLGQNRSEADQRGVYEALAASEDSGERALARMMGMDG